MSFLFSVFFSMVLFMTPHKPLDFISELIFLPVSGPELAGKKVGKYILPFQKKIIKTAMDHNGNPKKNIFMGLARKIGKSMLFSWILNYFLEEKKGFNSVVMASTFSQSNIIAGLVGEQIKFNPNINAKDYKIVREYIENQSLSNKLSKVFSKASSNLGMLNVSCVAADECGAMQSRENLNSILSGMALAQSKPLLMFASNPPESETHWSNDYLDNLRKKKNWKFFDFVADLKLDPYSKEAKMQANPFYANHEKTKNLVFKNVKSYIDQEAEDARLSEENLLNYRRMQLGQKLSVKAYAWVSASDLQTAPLSVLKNKNLRAIMGFDLALSRDFCAGCLALFNDDTEEVFAYPFLHLANVADRSPKQKTQFRSWASAGYITLQNKPSIDKTFFVSDIKDFLKKHKIMPEAYAWDRNLSIGFTEDFTADPILHKTTGFELGHAIRWIEARAKDKKIYIIGDKKNPCVHWMFDCAVCSPTSKGNVILNRASAKRESKDFCDALVMTVKYFLHNRKKSFVGIAV